MRKAKQAKQPTRRNAFVPLLSSSFLLRWEACAALTDHAIPVSAVRGPVRVPHGHGPMGAPRGLSASVKTLVTSHKFRMDRRAKEPGWIG